MALWSKDKLRERVARRQAARLETGMAERAALAWARWKGMTDEAGLDRAAAKQELDRLVDAIPEDEWKALYPKAGPDQDVAVRGVLKYSVARWAEQSKEMVRALEKAPDIGAAKAPKAVAPAPAKAKTRKGPRHEPQP